MSSFQLEQIPQKPIETSMEKYARQSRNAVVTMAVIMVLGVLVGLILAAVIAVGISHENANLNNFGSTGTSQNGF
jgi:sensor histidine kinase regulating citrate/malate metabolism